MFDIVQLLQFLQGYPVHHIDVAQQGLLWTPLSYVAFGSVECRGHSADRGQIDRLHVNRTAKAIILYHTVLKHDEHQCTQEVIAH